MNRLVRVVVADDHPVVIEGLADVLAATPDMLLAGVARTGGEVVEVCRAAHPDVVVKDLVMPELDGLAATRTLLVERPDTAVLVLTLHEDDDSLYGAPAPVRVDTCSRFHHDEVAAALRAVAAGEAVFGEGVASRILAHFGPRPTAPPGPVPGSQRAGAPGALNARLGLGTKEIAR